MSNELNDKRVIDLDLKQSLEKVTLTMPLKKSRTAFAKELIIESLKNKENKSYQHKYIDQCLEAVVDEEGKRMFTEGMINGAFYYLNKDLTRYSLTKHKEEGRVYYKYTTDKDELELNNQYMSLTEQLYERLNETFEVSNKLKIELFASETAVNKHILELITRISNIELFMLKNQIKP